MTASSDPPVDLGSLEHRLTEQLTSFGQRVARRIDALAVELRQEHDARDAMTEGVLAARLHDVTRSIRELQSAFAPVPAQLAALADRIRDLETRAEPDPSSRLTAEAIRARLAGELEDLREEVQAAVQARSDREGVVAARAEDALARLEQLERRVAALGQRMLELTDVAPEPPRQARLPLPDAPEVPGEGDLARRLADLERGHAALTQLTERTSRETAARLSRRIEDLRDAFGMELSELRRSLVESARSAG